MTPKDQKDTEATANVFERVAENLEDKAAEYRRRAADLRAGVKERAT